MLGKYGLFCVFMLFHGCRSQATGASNGIAHLSSKKTWVLDITGSSAPDLVSMYVDPNDGTCPSCEAPCEAQLPYALAYSQDCGHIGTIQNLANEFFGDQSYFAVEIYADDKCSDLVSLESWESGAVTRVYPMEKCHKFYASISYLFTPRQDGSVHAGYYETGACSGPATPIYGDPEDYSRTFILPAEIIDSTACHNLSSYLIPYGILEYTKNETIYGRMYTSYSEGGLKYGNLSNIKSSGCALSPFPALFISLVFLFVF